MKNKYYNITVIPMDEIDKGQAKSFLNLAGLIRNNNL